MSEGQASPWVLQLRKLLVEERVQNVPVDSPELIDVHRVILQEKPAMRQVFEEFYDLCMEKCRLNFNASGKIVELGAGSSFFKKRYPEILSTDIKPAAYLDAVVDASDMPFEDSSVRAIFGLNCFHHFPEPSLFFKELERALAPGGGVVLIEPYFGPLASAFYKRVFATEHFNKDQATWISGSNQAMTGANQALSHIVFFRDKKKWESEFPKLEIIEARPLTNYIRYFISGGLNFRQLVPNFSLPLFKALEWVMSPLKSIFGLHHYVVIRKKSN